MIGLRIFLSVVIVGFLLTFTPLIMDEVPRIVGYKIVKLGILVAGIGIAGVLLYWTWTAE